MDLTSIKKTSPLQDYWISKQNDSDEEKRLLKANKSPGSYLFIYEPYKWENLYQSIIREVIKGDNDSIKGLKILLSMIIEDERNKVIQSFSDKEIFNEKILCEIKSSEISSSKTSKNFYRFIRVLVAIFTNPYDIEIKGNKKHLYEKTGFIILSIKKLL